MTLPTYDLDNPWAALSLNTKTVNSWTLKEAVDGAARAGFGAIGAWRDRIQEAGVAEAAKLVSDAGLRVSSLCRGGFLTGLDDVVRAEVDVRVTGPILPQARHRASPPPADLQRRIAEKEIEVAMLRRNATPQNPQLRAAEAELAAWRAQLNRLSARRGGGDLERHVGAQRGAADHRLLGAEVVEQRDHLVGEGGHGVPQRVVGSV